MTPSKQLIVDDIAPPRTTLEIGNIVVCVARDLGSDRVIPGHLYVITRKGFSCVEVSTLPCLEPVVLNAEPTTYWLLPAQLFKLVEEE